MPMLTAKPQPCSPHGRCAIKPRSAGHFYVSAIHYFVMQSFLPIPLLFLSITAGGFSYTLPAQPLAVSSLSVVQAFVLARRVSFSHASSRFAVGASSLAFGHACVSRCLRLIRFGLWERYASRFVGRQPSCYRYFRIIPSSSGCANPAVERTCAKSRAVRSLLR